MRALLLANLSSSSVREAMRENYLRGHGLLSELMQLGQERGELRRDLPAGELAHVFRQMLLGTVLVWSVFGDASLPDRVEAAMNFCGPAYCQRIGNPHAAAVVVDEETQS